MEKQVYTVTVAKGATTWRNAQGQLHRLDGPAFERADGYKAWYQNDQHHRIDGPAVEWTNGDKSWWQNGQFHRLDGPAIEQRDGTKAWYLNGTELTEQEFLAKTLAPASNKVTSQELDRILEGVNAKSRAATKFHLEMVKKTTGEILLEDVEYCMNLSVRVEAYSKKTGTSHF